MPSTFRATSAYAAHTFTLLSLLSAAAMVQAAPSPDLDSMDTRLVKRAQTYKGCFSSSTPLSSKGTYMYQSSGWCGQQCSDSAVFGLTGGNECYCGDEIPASSSKVDDTKCNDSCTGYGSDDCGGDGFWSVYTTGTENNVPNYSGDSSSLSSSAASTTTKAATSPTTSSASVVTSTSIQSNGATLVVTQTFIPSPGPTQSGSGHKSGGGSSNTAGIAAGVVVGAVALASIIAGLFFFMRYKKRKSAEEDFKQRTQVSDFMRGGSERKPPSTGYSAMSDQRLDPEAGRRNSVGSLADNQDYSRRILRVANPDGAN